jgi:cellulose synthase/poly-beta-1,6-N-acetylglucosamine synthase-like glycosyltransferase
MIYITLLISFFYTTLILLYRISWNEISETKEVNYNDTVSVVVACRNEEKNIKNLIKDVMNQNFDKYRFDMIIVDDHSEDKTLQILYEESEKRNNLHIVCMNDDEIGKKNAIRKGVGIANGNVILCTDADCRVGGDWIKTMLSCFTNKRIKFVAGLVKFSSENTFLNKFQSLELISLVSSGAAAIQRKKSTICNGANLAFRKKEYNDIPLDVFHDFRTDDVSLLYYFKKYYKDGILFSKDLDSIVETNSNPNLISQFQQKLRWISNSKNIRDWQSVYVASVVFLMNLILSILLVLTLWSILMDFDNTYIILVNLFVVVFIKYLTDYLFLKEALDFFRRKDLLIYLLPFEIINAIYTVIIITLSLVYSPKWKGRKFGM